MSDSTRITEDKIRLLSEELFNARKALRFLKSRKKSLPTLISIRVSQIESLKKEISDLHMALIAGLLMDCQISCDPSEIVKFYFKFDHYLLLLSDKEETNKDLYSVYRLYKDGKFEEDATCEKLEVCENILSKGRVL